MNFEKDMFKNKENEDANNAVFSSVQSLNVSLNAINKRDINADDKIMTAFGFTSAKKLLVA